MTAGTVFLMWIGEQIDEYGIGNGISLIIMAGIVARIPDATGIAALRDDGQFKAVDLHPGRRRGGSDISFEKLMVLDLPCSSPWWWRSSPSPRASGASRRSRPSTFAAGASSAAPGSSCRCKVNQAGVMPVIFASSLLMLPIFVFSCLATATDWSWAGLLDDAFERQGYVYNVFYIVLIYFFCYFWTAITFNPKDMANNLKDYGSFIPGYRPGKRTADYLERVLMRITYVGAAFLAVVAIIPSLISATLDVDYRRSPASTAAPAC